MTKQQAAPFELGKITVKPPSAMSGHFQARGYYRDRSHRRQEATASGKSHTGATRALKLKVASAEHEHVGGTAALNGSTVLSVAADLWLTRKRSQPKPGGGPLAAATIADYQGYITRTIKGDPIGKLTVAQANSLGVIEDWLTRVANARGSVAAKQARKVLSGTLKMAERLDAIPASVMRRVQLPGAAPGSVGDRSCRDPEDCDRTCGGRHLDTRRAFTLAEMEAVQAQADASTADVGDLVAFLFVTGARISEALFHTAWADVDLEAETVRVPGTKTKLADRTLSLSPDLANRLRLRAETYGATGQVFGTTRYAVGRSGEDLTGKPRDRQNVLKVLRRVLTSAGTPWAGSHTFRRTVASWMDAQGAALAEIGARLGHGDLNVTAGFLGRTVTPTRAASIMVLP